MHRRSPDTVVCLDVEGRLLKTRLSTLTSVPGSLLERVFSSSTWKDRLDQVIHLLLKKSLARELLPRS